VDYSAKELLETNFSPIQWIIPNFLVEGLGVLGGKPKQGKSLFAINIAISITEGNGFLNNGCQIGDVAYLSLEDSYRVFKERVKLYDAKKHISEIASRRLRVYFDFPRMGEGGIEKLKHILKTNTDIRMIVIDPLVKFKPVKTNGYDADYKYLSILKTLGERHNVAILLVHHLKKAKTSDAIDGFSGSVGITGAADTLMLLRTYNQDLSELLMIGKNIEDRSYAMRLKDGNWDVIGLIEEIQRSEGLQKIYDCFKENPDVIFSPGDIASCTDLKVKYVKKKLPNFLQEKKIDRVGHGQYQFSKSLVLDKVPMKSTTIKKIDNSSKHIDNN